MLEQAREYLARVVAWPAPGEHGFVNIHWTFKPSDGKLKADGKFPWSGRAVKTLDEAMNALSYALKNAGTMDIYACMSSQSVAEQKQGKNNWTYWKAVRSSANAIASSDRCMARAWSTWSTPLILGAMSDNTRSTGAPPSIVSSWDKTASSLKSP